MTLMEKAEAYARAHTSQEHAPHFQAAYLAGAAAALEAAESICRARAEVAKLNARACAGEIEDDGSRAGYFASQLDAMETGIAIRSLLPAPPSNTVKP